MPRLVVFPRGEHLRLDEGDEVAGLRGEVFAFADDHAVAAGGEVFRERSGGEAGAVGVGEADRCDDADAQAHRDVLLDDFPAADFQRDGVGHAVLLEH